MTPHTPLSGDDGILMAGVGDESCHGDRADDLRFNSKGDDEPCAAAARSASSSATKLMSTSKNKIFDFENKNSCWKKIIFQ